MKTQGVVTIIAEVLPDRLERLTSLLADLDQALRVRSPEPLIDFASLDSVHFARFAVLPATSDGKRHLAFTSAYDGPRALHLTELATRARQGFCRVYEHCAGFPEGARTSPGAFLAYLEAHSHRHGALHVGYVGRSVADVRDEEALRRFVEERLDALRTNGWAKLSARAVRDEVIRLVEKSDFAWALEPREGRIGPFGVDGWRSSAVTAFAAGTVVGAVLAGGGMALFLGPVPFVVYGAGVVAVGAAVVGFLRHKEQTEAAKENTDVTHGLEHAEVEDLGVRNQLTHIVDVKPGMFRRALLTLVLAAVEVRARFEFFTGDLGGIETIHCAHWLVVGGEQPRLLFFSNYDGSWERYLGDFIEQAGEGMTSVWSNTVMFPRARLLLKDGATNERVFKAWTRERQVKTDVWYRADPDISVKNLNDNSKLRDGLRGKLTEIEAREWLRLV